LCRVPDPFSFIRGRVPRVSPTPSFISPLWPHFVPVPIGYDLTKPCAVPRFPPRPPHSCRYTAPLVRVLISKRQFFLLLPFFLSLSFSIFFYIGPPLPVARAPPLPLVLCNFSHSSATLRAKSFIVAFPFSGCTRFPRESSILTTQIPPSPNGVRRIRFSSFRSEITLNCR